MTKSKVSSETDRYIAIPAEAIANANMDSGTSLNVVIRVGWAHKVKIILITLSFAVASVFYALSLPNQYRSYATLIPVASSEGGGLQALAGQIGGLASLAGINLSGSDNNVQTAIEILRSRDFVGEFIQENQLLVPLMAGNGWDPLNDKILIDQDTYDSESGEWVRKVSFPKKPMPNLQEAHEHFVKDVMKISENKESGLVTISIEFFSPEIARDWLAKIIKKINSEMKQRDRENSQNSIDYLKKKVQEVEFAEVRTVFYSLIEEQIKTLMFTEVKDDYVFEVLDSPNVPYKKSNPKRALLCFVITFAGFLVSYAIASILYFRKDLIERRVIAK